MNIGLSMAELIVSAKPAKLINRDGELSDDWAKEKPSCSRTLSVYLNHAFEEGKQGKPFKSDYWQPDAGWGWLVAVPEVIEYEGVIYFQCRYWNWRGGFFCQMTVTQDEVECDGQHLFGYKIFKKGVGYQSNSQYFVTLEGDVYAYSKDVKSHEPVRYLPTGGINVGWTETVIHDSVKKMENETEYLLEVLKYMQQSIERHLKCGLRPIMNGYFVSE